MKKYFAKYLPVEGDITNGDLVMFKIDNKWTEPCSFDSMLGAEIQDARQGKLFLCSKEIGHLEKYFIQDDHREYTRVWAGENWAKPKNSYKVIGEVSSKAEWVKEGDEFIAEGKDCEVFPMHTHGDESLEMIFIDFEGKPIKNPIYLIKCHTRKTFL